MRLEKLICMNEGGLVVVQYLALTWVEHKLVDIRNVLHLTGFRRLSKYWACTVLRYFSAFYSLET